MMLFNNTFSYKKFYTLKNFNLHLEIEMINLDQYNIFIKKLSFNFCFKEENVIKNKIFNIFELYTFRYKNIFL